jgi:ABC-2 type transport system permease protein
LTTAVVCPMVFSTMVVMGLKRMFRYPWALLVSLVIDPVLLVLNIILFRALYSYSGATQMAGYSLERMIWYFACTNFIWYWIYNFTDCNIGQRIISGDLTLDLIRPVSVFSLELSDAVSMRISGVLFEFLPSVVIYSFIVAHPFLSVATLTQFCVSAALAFLLFFSINFLIGLLANFVQSTDAIRAIKHIVIAALGGAFIPLEFFPPALTRVLSLLPFSSIFYWPQRFFLGLGGGWLDFGLRSLLTALWIALFISIDWFLWKRAIKHFSGYGG